ncbi:MAG: PleD family two-component system response regulator [Pseudomonadota bacterium]
MTARILVVDDIEANRRLMRAKLEARYYAVALASGGEEALQKATQEQPDIILLDVMMPGMDGFEVCRRLKSNLATRHIPVVMLTALTDIDDRLRGLEAGADDFLSKPIEDFALFARLEALMRYILVASELRNRGSAKISQGHFSDFEQELLDRPSNILVIDQNEKEARRIVDALQTIGHTAQTWQDANASGIKFRGLDLVLIALSDQSHDALKLCANLRTLREAKDFSIVVTCRPEDQKLAIEALRIGAFDIVYAPLDMLELQARIRTQTRRKRYIDILRRRVDRGLELSVVDHLTGLYNRRYMLERLQLWMRRSAQSGKPVSIAAFDIDHFKVINDAHGHEAGDQVLKAFAERLRTNVRPKDIACRPGGEEFLVIMPETTADMAALGAERIRHAICAKPFTLERLEVEVSVTVSAGIASHYGDHGVLADLLHEADQALYRAKQKGRNRIERLAA